MISHAHRCICVHIPKTAGNSINRVFGIDWQDHKDLRRYAAELPAATFASYYKFAVVRNPWDRLFSDYNYQAKKGREPDSKLHVFKESGERRRFREWVDVVLNDPHRYAPQSWGGDVSDGLHRWSPQLDWIEIDGCVGVDAVLRLEELQRGFAGVCKKLGIRPVKLPHRNRRLHWHYSWYYDDATRDRIGAYYARDIRAFGYSFEMRPMNRMVQNAAAAAAAMALAYRT